jgi:hypothetical protein
MPKKKKYMVMARDKKTALSGITTKRGGHRSFGSKTTAMWISDKAEAEEIEHTYGMKGSGDVFVTEDEKYSYAKNAEQWDMKFDEKGSHLKTIHHYTFGQMGVSLPDRNKLLGTVKVINDVPYRYTLQDGKMRLRPISRSEKERRSKNGKS